MLTHERPSVLDVLLQRKRPFDVLLDMRFSVACGEPAAIELLYKAFGEIQHQGSEVPAALIGALRELSNELDPTATALVSDYLLHVKKLSGREQFYLVSVERVAQRDHMARATERFGFSHRESQVLALILRGDRSNEIARELGISPTTVSDYLTKLLRKTNSRNRSEMLSKVMHS
jgi:DNA-binding CsgD family transcriptional regulator